MFEAIGHPVLELKRTAYGKLKLGRLATGKYRFLKDSDIELIFRK
jgi:23S rRNA pseudouridine2605 synthase